MFTFLFGCCFLFGAGVRHKIVTAQETDSCIPVDDNNGTYVRCDVHMGMCGDLNFTGIANPHWECFQYCLAGLWDKIQYAAEPSLTSPRLCSTGVNVYALSFRYVWGDMTDVLQPFHLSVFMDTDTESTLLWSTNNGSADSSNITISCPDCSFRLVFRVSYSIPNPVYLESISLNYTGRRLPYVPVPTDNLFTMVVALVVIYCILLVTGIVIFWWRARGRNHSEDDDQEQQASEESNSGPGASASNSGGASAGAPRPREGKAGHNYCHLEDYRDHSYDDDNSGYLEPRPAADGATDEDGERYSNIYDDLGVAPPPPLPQRL